MEQNNFVDQENQLEKAIQIRRARIVAISYKGDSPKIGLTMRQPGLGKLEWIEEEKKKQKSAEKKAAKEEKSDKKEKKK